MLQSPAGAHHLDGDAVRVLRRPTWRNRDVWAISSSAFFADLGYKAVLAGFPLLLVLSLHQPVWEYGLASAISYGGGALFAQLGGRIGDRVGHRRVALAGNMAIPLLSLCALVANPAWAIGLLTGGWWARNLRSPSRRVMLVEAVPDERWRSSAFGFLHGLDVGGGALAGVYLLLAVAAHVPFRWIFLGTTIPLVASTVALRQARVGAHRSHGACAGTTEASAHAGEGMSDPSAAPPGVDPTVERRLGTVEAAGSDVAARAGPEVAAGAVPDVARPTGSGPGGPGAPEVAASAVPDIEARAGSDPVPVLPGAKALLAAAALYGFTVFSVGFPVLTVARGSGRLVAGIGAFLVLEAASAATGYLLGGRLGSDPVTQFARLGVLGYLAAAVGTGALALGTTEHAGVGILFGGVAIIGFGLGVVETLEPTAMSILRPGAKAGRAMGALSAARSTGTFVANLAMGLLYSVSASLAYGYAAALAAVAGLVVLGSLPAMRASLRRRDEMG